jgi:hypothetical protein
MVIRPGALPPPDLQRVARAQAYPPRPVRITSNLGAVEKKWQSFLVRNWCDDRQLREAFDCVIAMGQVAGNAVG